MKTRAGKFLLVIAGVVLAFLLAEFLVRVFLPQDRMVTWIEMHSRGFMMNQPNITAIHHFGDRKLRYHFNEYGLRGEEKVHNEETNILLLGDSFTFGLLLDDEDTYASLLQENLDESFPAQDFQVLNGGVGGAGLADWPAWLQEKGQSISPDIVILFLNYMDVDRALSKNLFVVEQDSVLTESIRWKPGKGFMSLGRMGWYRWLQEHSDLMNILVKLAWRYLYFSDQTHHFSHEESEVVLPPEDAFDPESGYSLQLAQQLTQQMQNWCNENDCTFILTTTGFFEKNSSGEHTYAYYETLNEVTENRFYFFDNTQCVKQKTSGDLESITIPGDTHPNEEGAKVITECSLNWLQPFLKQYAGEP